jgi:flagellar biosynthesis/type III secretory pathway protein FliH
MITKEEILESKFKVRGIRKRWIDESKQAVLDAMEEYKNKKLNKKLNKIRKDAFDRGYTKGWTEGYNSGVEEYY